MPRHVKHMIFVSIFFAVLVCSTPVQAEFNRIGGERERERDGMKWCCSYIYKAYTTRRRTTQTQTHSYRDCQNEED